MFKNDRYKFFTKEDFVINNAYLGAYRLYYGKDLRLKNIYKKSGGNLIKFIDAAKKLKNSKTPADDLERLLAEK